MSLKPDHTAADLRKLMDQFATAAEPASPAEQANRIRQQLTEMDYGGGRSPHAGMGLPRDDDDLNPAGRKEIIVKPETVKKTRRDVGDRLDRAFAQAYDDKGVTEDDMSALAGYAAGIVGGAAVPFAVGSLAFAFRDALHRTDELAKRRAQVDTAEIIALQRQIVSINKMMGSVKTDATKEKYQTMLEKAYKVLDELKARQGDQVAEHSMYSDEEVSWEKGGRRAPTGAFRNPAVVKTDKSIGTRVSDTGPGGKEYNVKTDKEWEKQKGVAEGRAGVDDRDTVGFSVNSEAAYNAVMRRFGDAIDLDETSGIMYTPARLWPQIEMVAFDADPDSGAVRAEDDVMEQGVAEAKSLARRVRVVKTGETGTIRQIKHGAYKGAPKTYYIDLDNGGQADNLPASALRLIKGEVAEVKSKTHPEQSAMDTPAVQGAIARMRQRHEKEPFDLEKAQALGQKLAARNRDPRRK
jgi:hypothetical protein